MQCKYKDSRVTVHFKKRNKEIHVTIEKVALKPFTDTNELEHTFCRSNSSVVIKEGIVDLKANYNVGFQMKM